MTFGEYQKRAATTAIYPVSQSVTYPALGLASEAGEVAGRVKKLIRDDWSTSVAKTNDDIAAELGDVLWYIAALCSDLGVDMEDVANDNLAKLRDRQRLGMLRGSGDRR